MFHKEIYFEDIYKAFSYRNVWVCYRGNNNFLLHLLRDFLLHLLNRRAALLKSNPSRSRVQAQNIKSVYCHIFLRFLLLPICKPCFVPYRELYISRHHRWGYNPLSPFPIAFRSGKVPIYASSRFLYFLQCVLFPDS